MGLGEAGWGGDAWGRVPLLLSPYSLTMGVPKSLYQKCQMFTKKYIERKVNYKVEWL